ncbi:hypothetical protein CEXT_272291 [Caerostris extrusa]|uniref:Uncharacterized protein n=1 Tax=Caerostris extrusa TaxID=172846 RepID=A0AAV4SZC8_CAEEX|nr:hypothetical protein CEXT_272291 [Caerostris extrusa]
MNQKSLIYKKPLKDLRESAQGILDESLSAYRNPDSLNGYPHKVPDDSKYGDNNFHLTDRNLRPVYKKSSITRNISPVENSRVSPPKTVEKSPFPY